MEIHARESQHCDELEPPIVDLLHDDVPRNKSIVAGSDKESGYLNMAYCLIKPRCVVDVKVLSMYVECSQSIRKCVRQLFK